jgi:hypothetical protein
VNKRGYNLELYTLTEVQQFSTSVVKAPDKVNFKILTQAACETVK